MRKRRHVVHRKSIKIASIVDAQASAARAHRKSIASVAQAQRMRNASAAQAHNELVGRTSQVYRKRNESASFAQRMRRVHCRAIANAANVAAAAALPPPRRPPLPPPPQALQSDSLQNFSRCHPWFFRIAHRGSGGFIELRAVT